MYRKVAAVALALGVAGGLVAFQPAAQAEEEERPKPVTVTGISGCAQCEGVARGHHLFLKTEAGINIVLTGDSESYQAAHGARFDKKKMTAVLQGPIQSAGEDENVHLLAEAVNVEIHEE